MQPGRHRATSTMARSMSRLSKPASTLSRRTRQDHFASATASIPRPALAAAALVDAARDGDVVAGRFADIGAASRRRWRGRAAGSREHRWRDGGDLFRTGFSAALGRGLFIPSARSASWRMPGSKPSRAAASRGRCLPASPRLHRPGPARIRGLKQIA
jgi:hypothetical protein